MAGGRLSMVLNGMLNDGEWLNDVAVRSRLPAGTTPSMSSGLGNVGLDIGIVPLDSQLVLRKSWHLRSGTHGSSLTVGANASSGDWPPANLLSLPLPLSLLLPHSKLSGTTSMSTSLAEASQSRNIRHDGTGRSLCPLPDDGEPVAACSTANVLSLLLLPSWDMEWRWVSSAR